MMRILCFGMLLALAGCGGNHDVRVGGGEADGRACCNPEPCTADEVPIQHPVCPADPKMLVRCCEPADGGP